jgi:predicted transcriptional regulator
MFYVYSHYLEILKDATYIHALFSCKSRPRPGLGEKVISGTPVELVVNQDVVELLKQEPYKKNMQVLTGYSNYSVWVTNEPLKVGLTATDKYLSLGLFKKDTNLYDSAADIFSKEPQAVAWGERLFQYYKERSTKLDFEKWF